MSEKKADIEIEHLIEKRIWIATYIPDKSIKVESDNPFDAVRDLRKILNKEKEDAEDE